MFWPGMGDPAKRKETLKFLAITAIIAVSVGLSSTVIQGYLSKDDPLKVCINDREITYKVSARLELYIDGQKETIPANVGFEEGCQRSMYTLSDDGVIYAEWEEEYPFEIGHFFWMWDFPLRDMNEDKSKIIMNGKISPDFIRTPFVDGAVYRAEFTSKAYDMSKDKDFLPPDT